LTLFHRVSISPQQGEIIHSSENLHKFKAINDKSKAIGRICLKFRISVTLPAKSTKELPEDSSRPEGKQSTRHGCSLSLRLSRGPNATIVRPDFLCLAVADTGITLDLDKDGHSDSNQNQDADHRKTFSCHNSYTFGCKRFSWGSFISTPPVYQKMAPQFGPEMPFSKKAFHV